jgi:hypothetical protein
VPTVSSVGSNTEGANPYLMLPVCPSTAQHDTHLPQSDYAPSVRATQDIFDAMPAACGAEDGSSAMTALGEIFARHEAPLGLMNKLTLLTELDQLELILDDSGSMGFPSRQYGTRWDEARTRLLELLEIVAHIPAPPVAIRFLNRPDTLVLQRGVGESAAAFAQRCRVEVAALMRRGPAGSTPAERVISESLRAWGGRSVARLFFGDGEPDGGAMATRRITEMLAKRESPARNPFTFISCTDDDAATEWMKECEEQAPFCCEMDDFKSEATEVREDQGDALPFTYGTYLVCTLVGAMCPDDLDSLDESIPMTRLTLENFLGYRVTDAEYRYYFDRLHAAQSAKRHKASNPVDRLKQSQTWHKQYPQFLNAPGSSSSIQEVVAFRQKLLALVHR